MLGKSVLPRVLVRVTLLLPAHLPVLIGQRVSHSGGCRLVLGVCVCRARLTHLNIALSTILLVPTPTLTFILDTLTHLLVQAGEQCVQYKGKC